jgi:hypothetical protein
MERVSIIPVGGLETSWEEWQTLLTVLKGSNLTTRFKKLENVKTAQSIQEINNM